MVDAKKTSSETSATKAQEEPPVAASEEDPMDDAEETDEAATEGVTFRYVYLTKLAKEKPTAPHISFRGDIRLDDLTGPSIWPWLQQAHNYDFSYGPASGIMRRPRNGPKPSTESTKTAAGAKDDKKEEDKAKDTTEKTDVEMDKPKDDPPAGRLRVWFSPEDGTTTTLEVLFKLLKSGYNVQGRSIIVICQFHISTGENKQEIEDTLKEYGAKETQRSLYHRQLCFKSIPDKLSEESIRESLPDVEHIEFKDDSAKSKCVIVTLPNPDRAAVVLKEKNGMNAFGSSKPLRVYLMNNLSVTKLTPLKRFRTSQPKSSTTKPSGSGSRGRGGYQGRRGGGSGGYGSGGRDRSFGGISPRSSMLNDGYGAYPGSLKRQGGMMSGGPSMKREVQPWITSGSGGGGFGSGNISSGYSGNMMGGLSIGGAATGAGGMGFGGSDGGMMMGGSGFSSLMGSQSRSRSMMGYGSIGGSGYGSGGMGSGYGQY